MTAEKNAEIAQRLRQGDRSAWEEVYDFYSRDLWRYVSRMLGEDQEIVAEVVQEVFLAASEEINEVEFPTEHEEESIDAELPSSFLKLPLEEIERQVILMRITHNDGNKAAAAETLGVTARTLRNKIDRYRKLGYVA
jgi:DNA-binding NtrC family response regulator